MDPNPYESPQSAPAPAAPAAWKLDRDLWARVAVGFSLFVSSWDLWITYSPGDRGGHYAVGAIAAAFGLIARERRVKWLAIFLVVWCAGACLVKSQGAVPLDGMFERVNTGISGT